MAPGARWALHAADCGSHAPAAGGCLAAHPLKAWPGVAPVELALGGWPVAWRPRTAPLAVSFEEKTKDGKEGAAAVEEKEGRDTDGSKLEPDTAMADEMGPETHGRTANKEACRCLPKSIEAPRAAWLLRKAAEGLPKSRQAHREHFRRLLDNVDLATRDLLDGYYKAEKLRDYAFEDLMAESKKTEDAAAALKKAFNDVRDAYSEGDCIRVVDKAEENGEGVPECHKHFTAAAKEIKEIRSLVVPSCKTGALTLLTLQAQEEKNIDAAVEAAEQNAKQSFAPMPPDLLVVASTSAVSTLARITLPGAELPKRWTYSPPWRKQSRGFSTSEFCSFL